MKKISKKAYKIKALIIEDNELGKNKVIYDKSLFDDLLKQYNKDVITKVYEFDKETRGEVTKYLLDNLQVKEKDGKDTLVSNLGEIEVFNKLIFTMTDIPYRYNVKKDREMVLDLLSNQVGIFYEIGKIINDMLLQLFNEILIQFMKVNDLDDETQEIISKGNEIKDLENLKEAEENILKIKEENLMKEEISNEEI